MNNKKDKLKSSVIVEGFFFFFLFFSFSLCTSHCNQLCRRRRRRSEKEVVLPFLFIAPFVAVATRRRGDPIGSAAESRVSRPIRGIGAALFFFSRVSLPGLRTPLSGAASSWERMSSWSQGRGGGGAARGRRPPGRSWNRRASWETRIPVGGCGRRSHWPGCRRSRCCCPTAPSR